MSVEGLKGEVEKNAFLYKVAPVLSVSGVMVIMVSFIVGLVRSGNLATYYASDKAARDGAGAGSALLDKLESISATQAWLLPLEIVGISLLLVGIALFFSTIIGKIRLRAQAMAQVLPAVILQRNERG